MKKRVSDSKTEHVQIILPQCLNGSGRLFGGQIMEWIDVTAAVVARRHSNCNVTTATVDSLQFNAPAFLNDTVVLNGYITYTGRTSMEVCVKSYTESLKGERILINTAYVVMVAVDKSGKPTEVPELLIETEEEKKEWNEALKRKEMRHNKRVQS